MAFTLCPEGKKLETDGMVFGTIPETREVLGRPFPLLLQPADGKKKNFVQLQEYFRKHHETILKCASLYGAVMFKGCDIASCEEWASVIYSSGLKEMPYLGGAAVRGIVVGSEDRLNHPQVVTTNESPASEPIPFHHELAQTPLPPSHICFYCLTNAAEGGSTPILRSDLVYNWLSENHPDMLAKFETQGVKYIRHVPEEDDPTSAVGRSWKSMFQCSTKEEAEAKMKADGWSWEWKEGGICTTITQTLPAVVTSSNGNKTFFNQVVAAYTGWTDSRNDPKKAVVFANGEALPEEPMAALVKFMADNACCYTWNRGQFVIVDNTVAYHSRQPFVGVRKIRAAIAKGTKPVSADPQTHLTLTSGDKMPAVGFGTWKIAKEACGDAVFNALKAGYRLIDEACDYGNEKQAGEGITRALKEGVVKREDLFVTSKLWNTYHRREHVKAACKRSLSDLGLDYLDLYLIHFPISLKFVPMETRYPPEWVYDPNGPNPRMEEDPVPVRETWEAMEELVAEGLVRNIGICNMGTSQIRDILSYAKVRPAVLQVELHPYNTQAKLLRYCRENGIAVTGFSSFGASSYLEMGMAEKSDFVIDEACVGEIAKAHNTTPAQVVLRWAVQRGTAVIPKSLNETRLKQNLDVFGFDLTEDQMATIDGLNKDRRFNDPGHFAEAAFNTFYPIYE